MKPARFDYARVDRIEEALSLLAEVGEDARILAGGQSLMAMMNMRLSRPALLIDLMHAEGTAEVTQDRGALVVGAGVRQAQLQRYPGLADGVPLLAKSLPWVGHLQTQARGTVCGSVAHADPSAELPLTLAALDGEVVLRNAKKRRTVPARDFALGTMMTDKADDELIEAVRFPLAAAGTGTGFAEIGRRKGDFAIVACAAVVRGAAVRLAVGGVNDTPFVQDWDGLDPTQEEDALNTLAWSLDTRDDMHASARYRRDLVRGLGRAAITEARQCAA